MILNWFDCKKYFAGFELWKLTWSNIRRFNGSPPSRSNWIKPNKCPFPGNMIRNQNMKMHIFSGVFKVWSWTINWSESWLKSLDIVKLVRISSVRFILKMFLGWRSLKHYPVLCFQIATTTMLRYLDKYMYLYHIIFENSIYVSTYITCIDTQFNE